MRKTNWSAKENQERMVSEKLAQESFSMGKAEVANEATEFRTLA